MPEYPWIIYRMSEGPLTTREVHQSVNEQLNRKLGTDWGYSEYEWAGLLQGFRPLPIRTASGTIAHFEDGADSVPMKSIVANIVPIQSGSGTPSPSNPRPISGTSVLNVEQTGKNLFDKTTITENKYLDTDGSLVNSGSYSVTDYIPIKNGSKITISGESVAGNAPCICYYDQNKTLISGVPHGSFTIPHTYDIPDNVFYIRESFMKTAVDTFQIEYGQTATTYEPYNAETYTIDLGQEIMGGTADVVGGVGSVTWDSIKLSQFDFSTLSTPANHVFRANYLSVLTNCLTPSNNSIVFSGITEAFKAKAYAPISSSDNGFFAMSQTYDNRIVFIDFNCSTVEEFVTAHANDLLCYPLATPTDFTFTGQPINSYLGVNNVWTDSGEVLNVEYRSNF